ncbi:MAG: hypothetical protein Q9184_002759 [Pyrenodesmia sp. 2 TL-2023]
MAEPIAIPDTDCRFPGGSDTPSKLWSVTLDPPDLSLKPSTSRFNIDPFYTRYNIRASRINDLDMALQRLPNISDRPVWTLRDELLKPVETSRIAEAALFQPLCTAVQIFLVDILRKAGTSFTAVIGHPSGEIGAAYAAGFSSPRMQFGSPIIGASMQSEPEVPTLKPLTAP